MRQKLNLRPSFVICLDIFYSSIIKNWYNDLVLHWKVTQSKPLKYMFLSCPPSDGCLRKPKPALSSSPLLTWLPLSWIRKNKVLLPEFNPENQKRACHSSTGQWQTRRWAFHFLITLQVWEWVDGWSTCWNVPSVTDFQVCSSFIVL